MKPETCPVVSGALDLIARRVRIDLNYTSDVTHARWPSANSVVFSAWWDAKAKHPDHAVLGKLHDRTLNYRTAFIAPVWRYGQDITEPPLTAISTCGNSTSIPRSRA